MFIKTNQDNRINSTCSVQLDEMIDANTLSGFINGKSLMMALVVDNTIYYDETWESYTYPPMPEPRKQKSEIQTEVTARLNEKAQEYGYDSIISAVSYANSTNPTYASEAAQFIAWRDDTWETVFAEFDLYPEDSIPESNYRTLMNNLPLFIIS